MVHPSFEKHSLKEFSGLLYLSSSSKDKQSNRNKANVAVRLFINDVKLFASH